MTKQYRAPRGTLDILPQDQPYWDRVWQASARVCALFGYQRIETPVFEEATLFTRGVGEATDIIQKEMYVFQDRGGQGLKLNINRSGDGPSPPAYLDALRAYYADKLKQVCNDCEGRYERNPLRLLDCKQERCQPAIAGAPPFSDHLCDACAQHFSRLRSYLDDLGIAYGINPRLVRGLDYYTRTVFEFQPPEEGAQSTVGGGGRYDGLIEQLGGRPTPGIGWATGIERIVLNLKRQQAPIDGPPRPRVFVAFQMAEARSTAFRLASRLRRAGIPAVVAVGERSLKAQMRQAGAPRAEYAAVLAQP